MRFFAKGDYVAFTRRDLPKDAVFNQVIYSLQHAAFLVEVLSKEFDVVPLGMEAPIIDFDREIVRVPAEIIKEALEE